MLTLTALAPLCAYAAPGDLDPSFGNGGKVVTNFFGSSDEANAVALQPDGKIVVVGENGTDFLVARYNADGSLDSSFGTGGRVTTDFGAEDVAQAVAIQPDGKIIVVGYTINGSSGDFALARYNPNGSLDSGFGGSGKLVTDFGGYDLAYAVALQPDGKLIAGGLSTTPSNLGDFALVRYNPNGTLDLSFGVAGLQRTSFGAVEVIDALVLQPDGKILAAGATATVSLSDANFALVRYNSNGTLDSGFGLGGGVTTDFGGFDEAVDIKLQADGKIVAAGYSGGAGGTLGNFALARYTSSGGLDTSFGTGGKVTTDFGSFDGAGSLIIQPDGKIIAAGATGTTTNADFALVRYNLDGSLDTSFGTGGKRTTDFGRIDASRDAVLQPDGKMVLVGTSYNSSATDGDFVLARYLGDSGLPQPGWWWNPDQSGRGFSIEVRGNNLFMAGYLYADDGRATWLVSGGPMTNVSTYSGPLLAFGNGQTLTGQYKSNTPTGSAGTITLQFSDASHGTLTWPGGTMPIERFPFGSGSPSFQPESGWWWNEAESGRGFAIEVQGNNLFMAGYMYDSSGNPIWYVSPGGMTSPTLYQGSWLQFANGQTLTGAYKAPSQPPTNVGAVALQFTSTTTATLTLPDGRQIPLTRFLF
ncbi:MAG: hypothetical protein HY028_11360 [Gammaproteobacteria bacterium]|nr:hypothetical protein [Gammaproteobacteria bacterium]